MPAVGAARDHDADPFDAMVQRQADDRVRAWPQRPRWRRVCVGRGPTIIVPCPEKGTRRVRNCPKNSRQLPAGSECFGPGPCAGSRTAALTGKGEKAGQFGRAVNQRPLRPNSKWPAPIVNWFAMLRHRGQLLRGAAIFATARARLEADRGYSRPTSFIRIVILAAWIVPGVSAGSSGN